jgi:hypothetical protein
MRGSSSAIRRGVKPRFTIARRSLCSGPSVAIRFRASAISAGGKGRDANSFATASGGGLPAAVSIAGAGRPFVAVKRIARDENTSGLRSTSTTSR